MADEKCSRTFANLLQSFLCTLPYLHLVNILVMPRYFCHTEVLIIKVYRKKVLLIPLNPTYKIYLVLVVIKLPNTLVLDLVLVIIYEICESFVHKSL